MNEQALWDLFSQLPDPKPLTHKLYYNDDGTPKLYTMEDLPGQYIEIDSATFFAGSYNVRVVDQKLVHIVPKTQVQKITPNKQSGTPCHPKDVAVVIDYNSDHIKWKVQHYEAD